jgi:hypothetical protein
VPCCSVWKSVIMRWFDKRRQLQGFMEIRADFAQVIK